MLAIGGAAAIYASRLADRYWSHTRQPAAFEHTLHLWVLGGVALIVLGVLIAVVRQLRLLAVLSALAGIGMLYVTGADMVRTLLDTGRVITEHAGQLWALQIIAGLVVLGSSLACLGRDPAHPHS